jgi:inner membrane protein YidH
MTDKNEMAEDRTKWAEDRTDWAEDRTSLANERTFAGWMRTGMASVGVGIGLKAVFGATDPTWVAKVVASIFLAAAVFMFWSARRQACASYERLNERDAKTQSSTNFTMISTAMIIGALATAVILWMI